MKTFCSAGTTRLPLMVVVMSLLVPVTTAAQSTRAEVTRQEQAEKLQQLQPPGPDSVAERIVDRLEDWGLLMGAPRGFYPWVGSVYPGGGMAGGAGVRKPLGDDGALNVFGGYSINTFSRAQADLQLPTFAQNRARITFSGRYVDAPDVRHFGVGNSSKREDETRFGYTPKSGGVRLEIEGRRFSVGGSADYYDIETSGGRTGPSIEEKFSAADTPGLEVSDFLYLKSTAHVAFDWRKPLGYSGQGGLYRLRFDDYREGDAVYSFQSVEAEVVQLIPILRANWVIALRGLATLTDIDESSAVPFFLLPSLGGGSTLRGYPDFRFRDRNRLLMNAELRWTPARFMDMAIFYDTGKVAAGREELNFEDLKESYGIGMRIIGTDGYAARLEVAHSREHRARLIVGVAGSF